MINLSRAFSTIYPYHTIPKHEAQKLVAFPLQFYSENPPKIEKKSKKSYNDYWTEIVEGATYGCGMFLSLLAKQNFKDLEDLVEINMFSTLKNSIKSYQDLGYTITSIGSTENAKVEIIDFHENRGALLPYRNLNLDASKYEIHNFLYKEPDPKLHVYQFKNYFENGEAPDFSEFESLDLKEISLYESQEIYKEQLDKIRWYLGKFRLTIYVADIGYTSTYKLLVKDKEGNIIEGTNDENKLEFHSFRMETLIYDENLISQLVDPHGRFKKFINTSFQDTIDEWIISDVDGFMKGNPFYVGQP